MPRGRVKGSKNKDSKRSKKVKVVEKVSKTKKGEIEEIKGEIRDLLVPRDVERVGPLSFKGNTLAYHMDRQSRLVPRLEAKLRELEDDTRIEGLRPN